ncbi:MAG: hypothetical protein ACKOQY_01930 [Bacteroidota bacterium]
MTCHWCSAARLWCMQTTMVMVMVMQRVARR